MICMRDVLSFSGAVLGTEALCDGGHLLILTLQIVVSLAACAIVLRLHLDGQEELICSKNQAVYKEFSCAGG